MTDRNHKIERYLQPATGMGNMSDWFTEVVFPSICLIIFTVLALLCFFL